LKDKISSDDRATLEAAIKETTEWVERHDSAEKEEFESKLKELESKCQPIMMKIYQAGGGGGAGGMPGGMPDFGAGGSAGMDNDSGSGAGASSAGPKVEEVD